MPPDDSLDLFAPGAMDTGSTRTRGVPLADRMRPRVLDELIGQSALLGPQGPLRRLAEEQRLPSLILWGPPGCGKTTLARLLAAASGAEIEMLSAVSAGVKEIRAVVERALPLRRRGRRCVLFLDEIHRLNRAQQDALLPHVEAGTFTLIGATTENPSFEVNAPLLSRCRVYTLERLSEDDLLRVLRRALEDPERGLGENAVTADAAVLGAIAAAADGDARRALGLLEASADLQHALSGPGSRLETETVRRAAGTRTLLADRDREEHYNVSSALIKSLRASDPDAALYWAARLLEAGDDPLFVARRLVIFASEDVGNADPRALLIASAAQQSLERIGMPEGRIPLAQAITYLACAPKSNASYLGIEQARAAVDQHGSLPVPLHLRNAPTALMRASGYGAGYRYPHDEPDAFVDRSNLPDALSEACFYQPVERGDEAEIAARLAAWRGRRARRESD